MTNVVNEAKSEFRAAAHDRLAPLSLDKILRMLEYQWLPFLQERGVRRDQVTMTDFRAWENRERSSTSASYLAYKIALLTTYYRLLANAHPDAKAYRTMAQELRTFVRPKVRTTAASWKPYPLSAIPRLLEAAGSYDAVRANQFSARDTEDGEMVPSEDAVLVALLVYTGLRASSAYGLRVKDVDLDARLITTRVKGGHEVYLPIHRRLVEIVKDHLASRPYESSQLFRSGRYAFAYADPKGGDAAEGTRALHANDKNVAYAMNRVEAAYARVFGPAALEEIAYTILARRRVGVISHRFRVSIGTYLEQYGFLEAERRLLLSHGAKSITAFYSKPEIRGVLVKWDQVDLGSAEWVTAHDPPSNLFAGNGDADLVADLRRRLDEERARNDRLERKLDELLARTKVVA